MTTADGTTIIVPCQYRIESAEESSRRSIVFLALICTFFALLIFIPWKTIWLEYKYRHEIARLLSEAEADVREGYLGAAGKYLSVLELSPKNLEATHGIQQIVVDSLNTQVNRGVPNFKEIEGAAYLFEKSGIPLSTGIEERVKKILIALADEADKLIRNPTFENMEKAHNHLLNISRIDGKFGINYPPVARAKAVATEKYARVEVSPNRWSDPINVSGISFQTLNQDANIMTLGSDGKQYAGGIFYVIKTNSVSFKSTDGRQKIAYVVIRQ